MRLKQIFTVVIASFALLMVPVASFGVGVVGPVRSVTPGAINPKVTQANIYSTICHKGYTATIRPASSYTTALKKKQLASSYAFYGDRKTYDFEEDHLIPLELGGAPRDPKNLWPEPWGGDTGARMKDQVENALNRLVCSKSITLAVAQKAIAKDWFGAYYKYVPGK